MMKLIASLSILSLIFVFGSSVPTGAIPRDDVDTSRWDRRCPPLWLGRETGHSSPTY